MTKVVKGSVFVGLHFNLVLEKRIQVFTSTVSILQRKDKIKWDNSIRWGVIPPFLLATALILSFFPILLCFILFPALLVSWFWLIPFFKRSRSAGKLLKRKAGRWPLWTPSIWRLDLCLSTLFCYWLGQVCLLHSRVDSNSGVKNNLCILLQLAWCFPLFELQFLHLVEVEIKGDVPFSFSVSVNRLFVGNKGCQYAPHANVWEKRYGCGTFYCWYAPYADFIKLVN